jgi:hypothetical protein
MSVAFQWIRTHFYLAPITDHYFAPDHILKILCASNLSQA